MFENGKAQGVYYSSYIASWHNVGGVIFREGAFQNWLRELGLTEMEIAEITDLALCGKRELEQSARGFRSRR